MAIEIKEYVGHEFVSVKQNATVLNLSEGYAETYIADDSIMVDIEAIHSRVTRNNTYYSPECLKESVKYWTYPYERPVIMHHNEKDGQIIGRIKAVEYTETNTRSNTPALVFTANIGNEQGKKGIKDGTLSTVSIGVIAHDLRCSICGTNLAEEGLCEHEKGEVYGEDNKLCYWIINKMEPKEVSYVIVPSDVYAHNLKVYDAIKKKKSEVKESVEYGYENPFADLIESTKASLDAQEGKQIDEEVKDKEAKVSEEPKAEEKPEENKKQEEESKEEETSKPEEKEEEAEKKEEAEPEKTEEESKEKEEESKEDESEESKEETEESKEEEANKELEEAKEKITALEKEVADLKAEKKKLETKVEKVTTAKESVEKELVQFRAEKKKGLVESVNNLRSQLNLPLEDEKSLLESSEESLHIAIKSLNEFTQVQKQIFGMQTMTSPVAISEEQDNTSSKENKKVKDVKESTQASNMTLEDEYINLMKTIF